jgi:hypothetical protein
MEHNMRVTENSVTHLDKSIWKMRHTLDWAARPMWMTEFSSTHMLCSCVTLVFFYYSVGLILGSLKFRSRIIFISLRLLPPTTVQNKLKKCSQQTKV